LEALGINLGYVFVQLFNFGILFVVLRAWVYKPIIKMLAERREKIAKGLEDARVAAEARANAEAQAEEIIAEAQNKASELVREATVRARMLWQTSKKNATRSWVKFVGRSLLWRWPRPKSWSVKRWMKNASAP
jgi:F-type H+-transporting ATPase subunit b